VVGVPRQRREEGRGRREGRERRKEGERSAQLPLLPRRLCKHTTAATLRARERRAARILPLVNHLAHHCAPACLPLPPQDHATAPTLQILARLAFSAGRRLQTILPVRRSTHAHARTPGLSIAIHLNMPSAQTPHHAALLDVRRPSACLPSTTFGTLPRYMHFSRRLSLLLAHSHSASLSLLLSACIACTHAPLPCASLLHLI